MTGETMKLDKLTCVANMWLRTEPEVYTIYKLTFKQTGDFVDFESAHVVTWCKTMQRLSHQTTEEYLNQFCTPTQFKNIEFGLYYTEPEFHNYSGNACINGYYGQFTVYMAVWRDSRLMMAIDKVKKEVSKYFERGEEDA